MNKHIQGDSQVSDLTECNERAWNELLRGTNEIGDGKKAGPVIG